MSCLLMRLEPAVFCGGCGLGARGPNNAGPKGTQCRAGYRVVGVEAIGYRTLATGDLAIAAWMPDVNRCSERHLSIWNGFRLQSPRWLAG
jgi:hypothetical protein